MAPTVGLGYVVRDGRLQAANGGAAKASNTAATSERIERFEHRFADDGRRAGRPASGGNTDRDPYWPRISPGTRAATLRV